MAACRVSGRDRAGQRDCASVQAQPTMLPLPVYLHCCFFPFLRPVLMKFCTVWFVVYYVPVITKLEPPYCVMPTVVHVRQYLAVGTRCCVTVVHVRQCLKLFLRESYVKTLDGLLCLASGYTCYGAFFKRPHGLLVSSNAKTPLLVGLLTQAVCRV